MSDKDDELKNLQDIKRSLEDAPIPDFYTLEKVESKIRSLEIEILLEKAREPISETYKRILGKK